MKAVVIKAHKPEVLISFIAGKGELVHGEEKPTLWEGWLYCTTFEGINGWVPKNYLENVVDKPETYQLIRSYNAIEISAFKGESVEFKESESGWAWVVNNNGEEGWIPLENLKFETC